MLDSGSNAVYASIFSPVGRSLTFVNHPWLSESILMFSHAIWYIHFGFQAPQRTVFQAHESMASSSLVVYRL